MTRQGQLNQKGINAQNWAAMSLFLQYVTRKDFGYIGFEGNNLEDFHLVFDDGRKIICESKSGYINLAEIRGILNKIIKHAEITDQDEILIICEEVDKEAKSLIENFKYFGEDIKRKLKGKKHKFEEKHIKLLPQLKFWEVSQDINRKAVEILMAKVLSYPEPFWVPEHRLQELTKSLVEDKVYKGSQRGETLSREDFLYLLKGKKVQMLEDDGYNYEKIKQIEEKELVNVIKATRSNGNKLNVNNEVTKLYANPSIHYFALQKLEEEKGLKLSKWENLWKATYQSAFSIELFKIFENNIQDKDNQKFILDFILSTIGNATNYFREEFIKYDIVKMCGKLLAINQSLDEKIFEITKQVYRHSIDTFLYIKRRNDDSWEREETSKLLEELYSKSNNRTKGKIINYIVDNFNFVEDDGEFWHYTPPSIFGILSKYVLNNPEELVPWFVKKCVEQYNKFYKSFNRKLEFKGWEHMGGGISQSGNVFSIADHHFVGQVLIPAFKTLYNEDKRKTWKYIVERCIARNAGKINDRKPDFLNRAVIPIILEEYKNGEHSVEAEEILGDLIKMRKGIPWKNDLIFQALHSDDYSDEQKWTLVKVSLDEFNNLPVNVFVEQIVFSLVSKNYPQASQVVSEWVENPEYNVHRMTGTYETFANNITKLLENKETFNRGVEIFTNYIKSAKFTEKENDWDTWDVAKALGKIITVEPTLGISILKEVCSSKKLTMNQQTLICSSINDLPKENTKLLQRVYLDFVFPFLLSLDSDISKIEKRITNRYSREQIVQFAEKLARSGYKKDALRMVEIFIHDSDPPKDGSNYPEDEKGEFNEHAKIARGEKDPSIRTVRGYCAWTLQSLVVPFNEAAQQVTREIIHDCVTLVRNLCSDPNYYVRAEGCIPLIELIKNRHTHVPGKPKERFISEKLAQEIEAIAFEMLTEENINLKQIARHLAMVFTYVRTLGTKKAKMVIKTFLKSNDEDVISEILPLFVYYALFRQGAFPTWPWKPLEEYDQTEIRSLLKNQLKSGSQKIRARLAWQFERLPDEISKAPEDKRSLSVEAAVHLSAKYMMLLLNKYDHEVFNDIYRFVEDYQQEYFDVCYKLWTECVDLESEYFKNNWSEDKLHEMYWWPFFYNGKILEAILDKKGVKDFLRYFKKLANYPTSVTIANDLDRAVERLVSLCGRYKEVSSLFDALIKRNPKYYEYKQRWINKHD